MHTRLSALMYPLRKMPSCSRINSDLTKKVHIFISGCSCDAIRSSINFLYMESPRSFLDNLRTFCLRLDNCKRPKRSDASFFFRFVYICTFKSKNMASVYRIEKRWIDRVRYIYTFTHFTCCLLSRTGTVRKEKSSRKTGLLRASQSVFDLPQ